MKRGILALLICFTPLAGAEVSSDLKFDEGLNLKTVIKRVEETEKIDISNRKFNLVINITKDCKNITFTQSDPLTSPPVQLTSVETAQDCQNLAYAGTQVCIPYTRYHRAEPKIVITAPRELKPGQTEVFEVCLWNDSLTFNQLSPASVYSVNRVLETFELTPAGQDSKASDRDACILAMDTDYTCVYRCDDGSFISKPNPFGPPSSPGMQIPFHGCRHTMTNTPLITVTK